MVLGDFINALHKRYFINLSAVCCGSDGVAFMSSIYSGPCKDVPSYLYPCRVDCFHPESETSLFVILR